jgi:hypothetical protein
MAGVMIYTQHKSLLQGASSICFCEKEALPNGLSDKASYPSKMANIPSVLLPLRLLPSPLSFPYPIPSPSLFPFISGGPDFSPGKFVKIQVLVGEWYHNLLTKICILESQFCAY